MSPVPKELKSVVGALADCYDQAVFLENAVALVASIQRSDDLIELVEEARQIIRARGASINLEGRWLLPVPEWLATLPRPNRQRTTRSKDLGQQGLLQPFQGGWLVFWDKGSDFSANDIRVGTALTHLIISTLKALEAREARARAQLEEHERGLAARIWHSVIPESLPTVPNYHLRALSQPAREVGGDFYSVAHEWLLVGDVSGKGVPAALFSAMFIAAFKLAVSQANPGLALEQALFEDLEKSNMFATVAGTRLDENGMLHYFNLGHPPIFIVRSGKIEELRATAPPMGTFPLIDISLQNRQLLSGDLIVIYSDGANEAKRISGEGFELFELERIKQAVAPTRSPEEALTAVMEALEGWEIDDDLTLVVAQYCPSERAT